MHRKDSSKAPRSAGTVSTAVGEPSCGGSCSSFTNGQISALERSLVITQPSPQYIDVKTKAWREGTRGGF